MRQTDTQDLDHVRHHRRNPGVLCVRGLIRLYQLVISPLFVPSCRYQPSCSRYAADAVGRFGMVRGGRLALLRLLSCHPWGGSGYDPVPLAPDTSQAGAPGERVAIGGDGAAGR